VNEKIINKWQGNHTLLKGGGVYLHVARKVGFVGEHFPAHRTGALPCVNLHVMIEAGAQFEAPVAQVTAVEEGLLEMLPSAVFIPVPLKACTTSVTNLKFKEFILQIEVVSPEVLVRL